MEIWKEIKGYEGLYYVSNFGRVKGSSGNIRKPVKSSSGYYNIILSNRGERQGFTIHFLVASAFIPNPNHYPCINHIDENKLNNSVDNLEWCTYSYNNAYSDCQVKGGLSTRKPVQQLSLDGKLVATYNSTIEAGFITGLNRASISKCCSGYLKTYKSFKWRYG